LSQTHLPGLPVGPVPPARLGSQGHDLRRGRRGLALPLAIGLQATISAGDGLAMIALANRVFQSSHASWAVAAVFLAVCVPISALAPVAGVLLDRFPTKPVLVTAAAAEALIALGLTVATGVRATLGLAVGFGICAALLQPGLGAIVPRLVDPDRVTRANSYLQAATWGGFTAGPLLAGLLITAGGSGVDLAADALLYALGALGLLALRLAPRSRPDGRGSEPAGMPSLAIQMRAGLSFLRGDSTAGMLVLIVGAMVTFANMAVVAEVVFAEHVLRSGPRGYSLLVAGWTSGMVIGTLAGGRLPARWLVAAALAGTVATGAGVALAGTAAVLWQAAAAYGFGGLANGLETVATRSFLNHRAPESVAGRVFALYSGILFGAASVGMATAAALLTLLGARGVLLLAGAGGCTAGLVGCVIYGLRLVGDRRPRGRRRAGDADHRDAEVG
jgi:MFS family permease